MGSFDRVDVRCPVCRAYNEVQSKAGKCEYKVYDQDSVPPTIAHDLKGEHVYCSTCSSTFKIILPPMPKRIAIKAVKYKGYEE